MVAHLQDVSKTYQDHSVAALRNVTLSLEAGQFIAVTGPSGCGKSTLLLTLGGLLRPDAGTVVVNDTDLYQLSPNDRAHFRAKHIGFVFQQFHLVPYLNVLENVLAAELGMRGTHHRDRAESLLQQFGLHSRLAHRPGQLSTGERQRVAMARALLNQPKLVLADEPTGNLDQENAERVLDELSHFANDGGTVMLVTHDPQAASRAQLQVNLREGRMVSDGSAESLGEHATSQEGLNQGEAPAEPRTR